MIVHRRFLTLIELIIVVTILLFVAGVVGFNIRHALFTQRFNSETTRFVNTLRLAQDMMLILSKDIYVKIRKLPEGEGIEYFIDVEGGVPRKWQKSMTRSQGRMETVHYINFLQKDTFPFQLGQIDLRFQSQGSMMSRGELQMASHEDPDTKGALRLAVCLMGYPHAIISHTVYQPPGTRQWIQCEETKNKKLLDQLTQYTREEIEQDRPRKNSEKDTNKESESDKGSD